MTFTSAYKAIFYSKMLGPIESISTCESERNKMDVDNDIHVPLQCLLRDVTLVNIDPADREQPGTSGIAPGLPNWKALPRLLLSQSRGRGLGQKCH